MEDEGESVADEGSGWLEVKKKHKSSSKRSLQKIPGCSSFKGQNIETRLEVSRTNGSDSWRGRPQASRSIDHETVNSAAPCSLPNRCQLEIDQDAERLDVLDLQCEDKGYGQDNVTESSQSIRTSTDDVNLVLCECSLNSSCPVSAAVFSEGSSRHGDSLSSAPSPSNASSKETNTVVTFGTFDQFPDQLLSSVTRGVSCMGLREASFFGGAKEVIVFQGDASEVSVDVHEEYSKRHEAGQTNTINMCVASPVNTTSVSAQGAIKEVDNISPVILGLQPITVTGPTNGVSFSKHSGSHEVLVTSPTGDQITDHSALDSTDFEGETAESKERFRQRLWCFLFENLNRAIDELYLLCELECDMEQINEAVLVLQEATSDFQELKARIECFDISRKSSPKVPKDGMTMAVKADHRRPHALSWEVRRMTTSTHKAEILSSSLEAFRKIQLEIARKHSTINEFAVPSSFQQVSGNPLNKNSISPFATDIRERVEKQVRISKATDLTKDDEKQNQDLHKPVRQNVPSTSTKSKKGPLEPASSSDKHPVKGDKDLLEFKQEKVKLTDLAKRSLATSDKDRDGDRQNSTQWKSMDAWKEKRNWEGILQSPVRTSRVSHSPGVSRKVTERARVLHDKLMSPEKKKRSALDMKREAEDKHARAMRIRSQLENERVQRLQRTSEKLNRVNEWQAVRNSRLREIITQRHQLSESRHEAYLAQVVRRAGDESTKVNEVRFITSLNEENKKLILRQKLHDSEVRRAEKLQVIKTKQKEDNAREEAVLERRRLLEAEKFQRLAETLRKKEEAQLRREEERKASSAVREARAAEHQRRKVIREKAQIEEAELLAQRLAEKLRESEQRRKFYLEMIRERASMDFRDQPSPFQRRYPNRDIQGHSSSAGGCDDSKITANCGLVELNSKSDKGKNNASLKRKIKKIRQRLMALKHEFVDPPIVPENAGIAYRAAVAAAKAKVSKWLQDLQRLRQARKEGAASIGLIVGDIIKYLEGKDLQLHAARQAGMLDFISSALPATHSTKPEACQVTVYFLRLFRVLLALPANQSYFLVQNLLPPIIPMLSASLENYVKVAASYPSSANPSSKPEDLDLAAEVLEGFLWSVAIIVGHAYVDDKQLQMQGGLIELIVAYHIIHHLRDLFALYDRPQLEGSPFPLSIIYGLNLLAVLTSRSESLSTIDWESCTCRTLRTHSVKDYKTHGSGETVEQHLTIADNSQDLKLHGACLLKSDVDKCNERVLEENIVLSQPTPGVDPREVEENDNVPVCLNNSESVGSSFVTASANLEGSRQPETDSAPKVSDCNTDKRNDNDQFTLVISAVIETDLICLPSLLTAVLLQANSKSSSEQASSVLPLNFEEVATAVLKVLNNLAHLDITLLQYLLGRPDLKVEFFHLISFLLTHCTNKWKGANDQAGSLLFESLSLLSYFALFHPGNQAVLRWGKNPTILHKVCDLPFVFFSDPELIPILASTLVATCYGSDQNRDVVLQELSSEMLLSLLKSCRPAVQAASVPDWTNNHGNSSPTAIEPKSAATGDNSSRSNRKGSARPAVSSKGGTPGSARTGRTKARGDPKASSSDDPRLRRALRSPNPSTVFWMLHQRFSPSFLKKAEEFFLAGSLEFDVCS